MNIANTTLAEGLGLGLFFGNVEPRLTTEVAVVPVLMVCLPNQF